jgi:TRAP-type mannitol/chloroaromatic compound transport system permease large subunit
MIGLLTALGIDTKWEILAFLMVPVFLLGFPFEWLEICLTLQSQTAIVGGPVLRSP